MCIRDQIFRVLPERVKDDWVYRATVNEVGFFGHGKSALDKDAKPLGRFAKWLLDPAIQWDKKRHQEAFREACMEVLGEDPKDWEG